MRTVMRGCDKSTDRSLRAIMESIKECYKDLHNDSTDYCEIEEKIDKANQALTSNFQLDADTVIAIAISKKRYGK